MGEEDELDLERRTLELGGNGKKVHAELERIERGLGAKKNGHHETRQAAYEEDVGRQVATWYAQKHGDKKYVMFTKDLMEKVGLGTEDMGQLTDRTLPDYIKQKLPDAKQRAIDMVKGREVSPKGVVRVVDYLEAVVRIVEKKNANNGHTPPGGLAIAGDNQAYEK